MSLQWRPLKVPLRSSRCPLAERRASRESPAGCISGRAIAVQSGLPEGSMLKLTGLRLVLLLTVLAALAEAGCAVFTIDTWKNKYLGAEQSVTTAGRTLVTHADLERSNGVFVGV